MRGQHLGGLVEDQDTRLRQEELEDLHLLLISHGELADRCRGIDVQAEPLAELADPPLDRPAADDGRQVGEEERDVLEHAERRDEHEVLEHHADPPPSRVTGRANLHPLAVAEELAGVGADEAVQDLRERALARAVFTQERVHLVAVQAHVGLVVGEHGTVPPGEAAGFEQGLSGRVVHLWSPSETFRPGRGASPPHKRQKRISQVKAFEARSVPRKPPGTVRRRCDARGWARVAGSNQTQLSPLLARGSAARWRRAHAGRSFRYRAGVMFWFRRKRLPGSYSAFSFESRS